MSVEPVRRDPPCLLHGEWITAENRFYQILKNWKLTTPDQKYIFLSCNYSNQTHLIVINNDLFLNTVNKNIALFRYILGRPNLTAKTLLEDLIKNEEHFWDVIKDDIALTGILLGYGAENSVAQSQYEIMHIGLDDSDVDFPYVKINNLSFQQDLEPDQRILSTEIKPRATYPIPYFACYPDSEETIALLSTYEKNRDAIIEVASRDNFLESILQRIFKTTSNTLKLPETLPLKSSLNLDDKLETTYKLAELVHTETKIRDLDQNYLLEMFVKGMDDAINDIKPDFKPSFGYELDLLKTNLIEFQNLEKSNALLKSLSNNKDWTHLINNNILFKRLKKGSGPKASSKIEDVTFHYSFHSTVSQQQIKAGTISHGELENFIPGIAHSLIGMKKGEERLVCIHPRYAYGDLPPFPNEAIIVNIHLVDFKEGKGEAFVCRERSLDSRVHRIIEGEGMLGTLVINQSKENCSESMTPLERIREKPKGSYKDVLALYEKSKGEYFYFTGRRFWESLTEHGILIDYAEFKKHLHACDKNPLLKTDEQRIEFLTSFNMHIFRP